ncbi:MAG: KOW domain-containing RNA-binding protein [Clostridiales bacterium]|nr:KOW domain-containing RNA-binding protein [Clostridiales bacterium]
MDGFDGFQIGQLVISKAGRDKGTVMVVMSVEPPYLYLCDGKTRPAARPKKKKITHVQKTNAVSDIKGLIIGKKVKDSDIRRACNDFAL